MTDQASRHEKLTKPHAAFNEPHEVVTDATLTKGQKSKALDALEQDARQLSIAASEGMTGGEPTGLHEVLDAKDTLALPPIDMAYDLVVKDLRTQQKADKTDAERVAIEMALLALAAHQRPHAN